VATDEPQLPGGGRIRFWSLHFHRWRYQMRNGHRYINSWWSIHIRKKPKFRRCCCRKQLGSAYYNKSGRIKFPEYYFGGSTYLKWVSKLKLLACGNLASSPGVIITLLSSINQFTILRNKWGLNLSVKCSKGNDFEPIGWKDLAITVLCAFPCCWWNLSIYWNLYLGGITVMLLLPQDVSTLGRQLTSKTKNKSSNLPV